MKRIPIIFETIFDSIYLITGAAIAILLLVEPSMQARLLSGIMAAVLIGGDSFHLFPRIAHISQPALGRGKQITSITMTIFYLLLWHLSYLISPSQTAAWVTYLLYGLAIIRILLCLMPQNQWTDRHPPVSWGIWRNIPFTLMGLMVAVRFFQIRNTTTGFTFAWLAILLSFLFYLPVVFWADRQPKLGMLMLPKTCCYIWLLFMCLSL